MRNIVKILGVPVDVVTLEESGKITKRLISESNKTCKMVFAPNTEFIMTAQKDKEFFDILNMSELSTPDSIGITIGARRYGNPLKERIPGQAYFRKVMELSEKEGYSVYLLGGKPGVPEKTKENILTIYPKANIVGLRNGYFDEKVEQEIINEINKLQPNVLFVALGHPKQEKWIYHHKDELKVDIAAGQGGTYDYEAGVLPRAPKWIQKIGMEWMYRLILEPSRIKRMMVLPIYLLKIAFTRTNKKGESN